MKSRGIVFEKRFGSNGERLPHPLRVRLIDGPNADPDGPGFCLLGTARIGATVVVDYAPDDQFAYLVTREPAGARMDHTEPESAASPQRRAQNEPATGSASKGEPSKRKGRSSKPATGAPRTSKAAARAATRSPSWNSPRG